MDARNRSETLMRTMRSLSRQANLQRISWTVLVAARDLQESARNADTSPSFARIVSGLIAVSKRTRSASKRKLFASCITMRRSDMVSRKIGASSSRCSTRSYHKTI